MNVAKPSYPPIAFALIVLLLTVAPGLAQTNTGEITGVVHDAQGGVLPGVTVIAEHLESGTRIERVTDEQGRYLLPSLRVGTYPSPASLPASGVSSVLV